MDINEENQVIKLSFTWLVAALLLVLAIGALGGILAQQFLSPRVLPLSNNREAVVTTIQEVTVAPGKIRADIVKQYSPSILSIGEIVNGQKKIVAAAAVITNDGIVVSTGGANLKEAVAFDANGISIPLSEVGSDLLFGLNYWQLTDNVVPPLDLAESDQAVGDEFTLISPATTTATPTIKDWILESWILPSSTYASGISRIFSTSLDEDILPGSAILTDNGKLAGMAINTTGSHVLPVSTINQSFNRVTKNQREQNIYLDLGFSPEYTFINDPVTQENNFAIAVNTVASRGQSQLAGLKRGDIITTINGEKITWTTNIIELLNSEEVLTFEVLRRDEVQSITFNGST